MDVSDYNGYNIRCMGDNSGWASVDSILGGYIPYTFLWSNGATSAQISNLYSGSYSVEITDALGCKITPPPISLLEPQDLPEGIISATTDYNGYNISCYNGDDGGAQVSMSGGVSPYSYNWNNGNTGDNITNLTAGFYQVQAEDDNGCLWIDHIVLYHPDSIDLTINFAPDTCSRAVGFAEAIVSGGVGPYDYLWDRGDVDPLILDFSLGSYELSILDKNNCPRSKKIDILDLESPIADFKTYPEQRKLYEQIDNPFSFVDYTNGFWQQVDSWQWDIFDSKGALIESILGGDSVLEYSFDRTDTFTVLLTIITDHNCEDTISKKVIVNDFDIFIPNTFTPNPNKDNINSTFKAYGFGIKEIFRELFFVMFKICVVKQICSFGCTHKQPCFPFEVPVVLVPF